MYGPSSRHAHESPRTGGAKILIKGKETRRASGPIPLSKISVDVRTHHDNSMTTNTSDGVVSTGGITSVVRDSGQSDSLGEREG